MKQFFSLFLGLILISNVAVAEDLAGQSMETVTSNRSSNQFGLYLGVIEPFPSLVSANVAYNILDYARVSGGVGYISGTEVTGATASITTVGFAARGFVPHWSFTPTLGLGWANVSISGTLGSSRMGFAGSDSHFYVTLGFDWQATSGFHVGGGWNHSLKSGVDGLPYLTLGWFFDWLNV